MTSLFWTLALGFAGLAALLHVYIFWMESLAWETPKVRRTFGTSAEQAAANKQFAFNQGFYNLFLAISTGVGIALAIACCRPAGLALVISGTGSMVGAALVLVLDDRRKLRAAIVQATFAKLSLLSLLVWALVR